MVSKADIVGLVYDKLMPLQSSETERAKKIDAALKGAPDPLRKTQSRDVEKATLRELSHTSLLQLIVEYTAQQLVVEGVSSGTQDTKAIFRPFEQNGLPSKQGALHRAVLSYGLAYGLTLPGRPNLWGPQVPFMRGFSPKNFGAIYADPVDDEFPMWAWRVISQGQGNQHWRVYDDEVEHFLSVEGGTVRYLEGRKHGMGVCPVVRFGNAPDLDENVTGEPDKYRVDAARHDKTVYDRLSIQHYNSWRIRTATKLDSTGLTPSERERIKMKLAHDDILIGEGDTEFGTLDETNLAPMVAAQESDRDLLAAVSQTPVWAFNGGSMVNLSADALVEAKSGNRQKVWDIQRGLNRPYCNWLRLASRAEGREKDAWNFDLIINWADIGSQSLAAAADALGKVAVQLGVPVQMLWEMIPGVSHQTVARWKDEAENHPTGDLALAAALTRQADTSGADLPR